MQGWGRIREAANYAGLSQRSLRRYLKLGLKHSKLPTGTILIKFSDIDEFFKKYSVDSNQAQGLVDELVESVI